MPTSAVTASKNSRFPLRGGAGARSGFTLMELTVVLALIAVILAVALPQFATNIAVGQHEGAARQIAEYGREAMNYCALAQHHLTVKIDLDNQEIWSEEWPDPVPQDVKDNPNSPRSGQLSNQTLTSTTAGAEMDEAAQEAFDMCETFDLSLKDAMQAGAIKFAESEVEAGMLDQIGPLFEKEFTLDNEDENQPKEIESSLLERFALDNGITITSVWVGEQEYTKGEVDVDVTSLGMAQAVIFYVKNSDGDYYTVKWDPAQGTGLFASGKQDDL